jgi:hypothetical protein
MKPGHPPSEVLIYSMSTPDHSFTVVSFHHDLSTISKIEEANCKELLIIGNHLV